jgi:hypothetical protein
MCNSDSITFDALRQSAALAGLPVAHLTGPRTARVPSATTPGAEYTVDVLTDGRALCTCKDGGALCWHGHTARQLVADRKAAIIARGTQAAADLFGVAA